MLSEPHFHGQEEEEEEEEEVKERVFLGICALLRFMETNNHVSGQWREREEVVTISYCELIFTF